MIGRDELVSDIGETLVAVHAGDLPEGTAAEMLARLAGTIVFVIQANGFDPVECDARILTRLNALRAANPETPPAIPVPPAKYSAEWLRLEVAAKLYTTGADCVTLDHHACSLCGHVVFYSFDRHGEVWWNGACRCPGSGFPPVPSDYDDVAKGLGLQSGDAARDRILRTLT